MRDEKELIDIVNKTGELLASYELTILEVMAVFKLLEISVNKNLCQQSTLHYEIPMETTK